MSGFQGRLPIILNYSLVLIILVCAVFRFSQLSGWMLVASATMVALYLAWLAIEARVAMSETKKEDTNKDYGTLEIYAAGRFFTTISALLMTSVWNELNITMLVGAALFVGGVSFRLYAIRTLGRFYSHRVRMASDHQIVSNGPYAFLRHPAYTGMLICHFGFVLFFFNWVSLVLWGLWLLPAVVARILVEEKMLMNISGYTEFAKVRKRIVPFIW